MEKIEVFAALTELLGQPNGIDKIAELEKKARWTEVRFGKSFLSTRIRCSS